MRGAAEKDVPLDFCPLDLYSGEEQRVRRALNALWDGWASSDGGINNLRIFAEGRVLKPSEDVRTSSIRHGTAAHDLLVPSQAPSLRKFLTPAITPSAGSLNNLQADFVEALLPVLLSSSVLRLLSYRQRTLDSLDIEGLVALWARIHTSEIPFGDGVAEPTLEEWTRFVDAYLGQCEDNQVGAAPDRRRDLDEAELRYYCLAYLLSATFKDCSIVIRFDPHPDSAEQLSSSTSDDRTARQDRTSHVAAQAEVKLIDLDVKSIKRLAKWEKMDRDIVQAYARVDDPRTCVDSLAGMCGVP